MDIEAGSLVYSIAGRDKNGLFAVLDIKDGFCFLADGKLRKSDKPKRKKIKHIRPTGQTAEFLKGKLQVGERPTNSEIRKAIAAFCNESAQSS